MYHWMRKIHMYAGLLSFTALLVWGITGIHAVLLPSPGNWKQPPVSAVSTVPNGRPRATRRVAVACGEVYSR